MLAATDVLTGPREQVEERGKQVAEKSWRRGGLFPRA
jgi:hypothetical protein